MSSAVLVHVVIPAEGQVGDPLHTCTCPPGPLYMLFVQLERLSSSAPSRRVEVQIQAFTGTSPLSNHLQQTDVGFGARLRHGCSSHRCLRQERSFIVLISAPRFLKRSLRLLSLCSFCWVLVVFPPHRDPLTNYRKYTVFPQRALRASTISDNSAASVKVIYYLCRADCTV